MLLVSQFGQLAASQASDRPISTSSDGKRAQTQSYDHSACASTDLLVRSVLIIQCYLPIGTKIEYQTYGEVNCLN